MVWSLLNPLLLTLVLFVAFRVFLRIKMESYAFFLIAGLFAWNWFSASVTISTGTLISNVNLIKRIRFPRQILVIAAVLAQLVNLIFAIPIIAVVAFVSGEGPGVIWLLGIPVLVTAQLMVTVGICMAIAMVNAYFRDMEHLVAVLCTSSKQVGQKGSL